MKGVALLSYIFFLCFSYSCQGQDYSYSHYDVTDGLAGSVAYCITQDKDGYIWIGTETGVSRFDGTHFRTFTTDDGLPDVEVLEIFGDSKGRVWMAPFRKSICYYYNGRIHNQENDSLLRHIHLRQNVERFAEDAAGNILILESTALHWIGIDGRLRELDSISGHPVREAAAICRSSSGKFLVQMGQQVFLLSDTTASLVCRITIQDVSPLYVEMSPGGVISRADSTRTAIVSFRTGKTKIFPFSLSYYKHLGFSAIGDSLFYVNELSGTTEYNLNTGVTKHYLPGKPVSCTFRDVENNTWFTTAGQGIYRLNSGEFKTIRIKDPENENSSIYAIRRFDSQMFVGDNYNQLLVFSMPEIKLTQRFSLGTVAKSRILFIGRTPDGRICLGKDDRLASGDMPRPGGTPSPITGLYNYFDIRTGIKSAFEVDTEHLIVGTYQNVLRVDLRRFRITDTLWRERATAVFSRNDTVYIGTLNGLYQSAPDATVTYMGKSIPFLQNRISAIVGSSDGTVWIASYDDGVCGYRNGTTIAALTKENGLTSNICRSLLLHGNTLWIGTDQGLNRVQLDKRGYPVTKYTSKDGLASDIINSVYADGSVIFVGTSAGLSYFDETKVYVSDECRLHLLSIQNSGRQRIADTNNLLISYRDKHIRFEFVGISYRSSGNIVYRYRLLGLDSAWRETHESFLEYPTLPGGNYVFQLQAINKFGINSKLLSLPFVVGTPFWQTAWGITTLLATFLLLVWFFVDWRIRRVRRRQKEKEHLNQRLIELETTALQSQMNPHFIFNCLNSIQQYILDHEALVANRYLADFARLIRATLYNSSKTFISLTEEVDYLSTYLSLENLRFQEKMEYAIDVDTTIDKELFIIPPMLIQPFVENSMRHGLRHKKDGKGIIQVSFALESDLLRVVVEDNGIGRKKAGGYKTREHIEYQSKGMSLTADRIRVMNVKYQENIQVEVIDLENGIGSPSGTRVILRFPLFHQILQNEIS